MRGQMPVSLFAIVLGALETSGAMQELVNRGFENSERDPLVIGTLGTVAGVMLICAGVALLIRSPLLGVLAPAAAYVSVPVSLLAGVVTRYAGWPATVVGIAYPLFLLFFCRRIGKAEQAQSNV